MIIKKSIKELAEGKDLSKELMEESLEQVIQGKSSDAQIASFLTALHMKGITADEIAAAVQVMRKHMNKISPNTNGNLLDVCGTGGDKLNTFNISTTVMFVAAGAGCSVVKHGNNSVSSLSGSADLLQELGVSINLPAEKTKELIERIGIGFLYAPLYHKSTKNVSNARKEIGIKTLFNIIGPLTNPASAKTQLLGAYNESIAEKLALALQKLNAGRALVVHGLDGLDEFSTVGKTIVFEVNGRELDFFSCSPEDFGFKKANARDLEGGNPKQNALILRKILQGENSPRRDIVLLNAGAALYANKKAGNILEGIELAKNSIDSGNALKKLELLVKESNESGQQNEYRGGFYG